MGQVRLDPAGVHALARRVLDSADVLDEIHWPTVSGGLPGSAVEGAIAAPGIEDRVADVVARMRTWAAVAQSAAAGVQGADARHAARLGQSR